MDTYLPTYLPTGPSFQHRTFPLAIKEKRSAQSERKRALFLPFSFLFCQLCHYCWQMGSVSPLGKRKESKRKDKKRKEKEKHFCSESIILFHPFSVFFFSFFFLLYSFTLKGL